MANPGADRCVALTRRTADLKRSAAASLGQRLALPPDVTDRTVDALRCDWPGR